MTEGMAPPTHAIRVIDVSKTERYSKFLGYRGSIQRPVTREDLNTIANEVFHRRILKFKRGCVIQRGLHDTWSCDLAEFPANRGANYGYLI